MARVRDALRGMPHNAVLILSAKYGVHHHERFGSWTARRVQAERRSDTDETRPHTLIFNHKRSSDYCLELAGTKITRI
jgi:hypothetical protein